MMSEEEVKSFIGASFRSVWTLELLCQLQKGAPDSFLPQALVTSLRASDLVIRQGLAELVAIGLVVIEANGEARYAPATPDLERLANAAEALYAKAPNAVRRIIVNAANRELIAFSDAFRLRGDQ